jgi:hypothetical protein
MIDVGPYVHARRTAQREVRSTLFPADTAFAHGACPGHGRARNSARSAIGGGGSEIDARSPAVREARRARGGTGTLRTDLSRCARKVARAAMTRVGAHVHALVRAAHERFDTGGRARSVAAGGGGVQRRGAADAAGSTMVGILVQPETLRAASRKPVGACKAARAIDAKRNGACRCGAGGATAAAISSIVLDRDAFRTAACFSSVARCVVAGPAGGAASAAESSVGAVARRRVVDGTFIAADDACGKERGESEERTADACQLMHARRSWKHRGSRVKQGSQGGMQGPSRIETRVFCTTG